MALLKKVGGLFFIFIILGLVSWKFKTETFYTYKNEVVNLYLKEISKDLKLPCIGGGGSMLYDIQEIAIIFFSRSNMTIEEARVLEVELIERFLRIINNNKKIRPYLREYPFPPSRVDISLSFEPIEYRENCVSHAFQVRGKLFYYTHGNVGRESDPDLEEPYEEAYNIVKSAKPEIAHIYRRSHEDI